MLFHGLRLQSVQELGTLVSRIKILDQVYAMETVSSGPKNRGV